MVKLDCSECKKEYDVNEADMFCEDGKLIYVCPWCQFQKKVGRVKACEN